jgi:hypothetical protein
MAWLQAVPALLLAGAVMLPAAACSGQARDRYEPRTFLGYACEDDCQRHMAGFAWAARRRLSESRSCDVLGSAQAEGCRVFVEERLTPEAAGYRWALENEIGDPSECEGAGTRFRTGCLQLVTWP